MDFSSGVGVPLEAGTSPSKVRLRGGSASTTGRGATAACCGCLRFLAMIVCLRSAFFQCSSSSSSSVSICWLPDSLSCLWMQPRRRGHEEAARECRIRVWGLRPCAGTGPAISRPQEAYPPSRRHSGCQEKRGKRNKPGHMVKKRAASAARGCHLMVWAPPL